MGVHAPSPALTDVLRENHIYFEVIPHRRTQSAVDEAREVGTDLDHVAKTVVLETEDGFVRAVIPAYERLSLRKVRKLLGKHNVHLASEQVLAGAYPEFELGAVPPVGGPPNDLVLIDERLRRAESVVFDAGTHEYSVRVKTTDLAAVSQAQIADIHEW
jgi:Ala-tRNA(Pro) deacylase